MLKRWLGFHGVGEAADRCVRALIGRALDGRRRWTELVSAGPGDQGQRGGSWLPSPKEPISALVATPRPPAVGADWLQGRSGEVRP